MASPEKEVPGPTTNFYKFVEHRTEKHLPIPIIPYVLFNTNHPRGSTIFSCFAYQAWGPSLNRQADRRAASRRPRSGPCYFGCLTSGQFVSGTLRVSACYTASQNPGYPQEAWYPTTYRSPENVSSRHWGSGTEDVMWVFSSLTDFHKEHRITFLVTGGCPTGVDKYAKSGQMRMGLMGRTTLRSGIGLGCRQDQFVIVGMLTKHHYDACIVFPGGSGTADMRKKALRRGSPYTTYLGE